MKICFIGSGIEREDTKLAGIEIHSIAKVVRNYFDTLVFGGSNEGLMEAFASAFAAQGGHVISAVPRWLHEIDLVYKGGEIIMCEDLAERKKLMFAKADAVLCYPGGLGTWDELFDLLARRAIDAEVNSAPVCPPIYLYNWENYYAPLLLQIDTAVEVGLVKREAIKMLQPFETVESLMKHLENNL
jgi:uncharacterized protein (TIGR00730 family)